MASDPSLRKRLLRDLAELQSEPYPFIEFLVHDSLEEACLIFSPEGSKPLHLKMALEGYPLRAPRVTIQSRVSHPNVYGDYICASILNTQEGYTPAYTLKSIAIQLLSFFISDSIEQQHGGSVALTTYKGRGVVRTRRRAWIQQSTRVPVQQQRRTQLEQQSRVIKEYRFVMADERRRLNDAVAGASITYPGEDSSDLTPSDIPIESPEVSNADLPATSPETLPSDPPTGFPDTFSEDTTTKSLKVSMSNQIVALDQPVVCVDASICSPVNQSKTLLMDLPLEILLTIFSSLSFLDLAAMSSASPKAREIIDFYDLIRVGELQCFCLKEHFQDSKLGVGVNVGHQGKEKKLSSEFDLLSHRAFYQHRMRRSIHGLPFEHWLPLPISRRHFGTVKAETLQSLDTLASAGNFADASHFSVLSHFLTDIVVSFSEEAERSNPSSTLTHASEKAVESYFAIYHLLLCLAADNPSMVRKANHKILHFLSGQTSKTTCPNLGHLLVATLISDHPVTETLSVAIIKEAILRNVVWMLDPTGADMPELSYLEPTATSDYRLQNTFAASRTSYRLLMFCHLFCKTARGINNKPLAHLRDDLFSTHGAPPRGLAPSMAREIRRIKSIAAFPPFLQEMGVRSCNMPGKAEFTAFLREMVRESVEVGYSTWPMGQTRALGLRILKEPGVEVVEGLGVAERVAGRISFFPGTGRGRGGERRGGRGVGRGRGRW
ncbi:MAG: hypothetical protein LQ339_006633 [Xanthoria mediterranea]|nr:MAG: hypothetical protein LQ339_006633 [Xanthoria mediterranea]